MPRRKRPLLVIVIGAAIAAVGVVLFLSAHAIATPDPGTAYAASERDLHETLWAAFGIAAWLGGVVVAAVGLSAWSRDEA
jgi:hypothetical protein